MSGRGLSAAIISELGKDFVRPIHLLEVDFTPYIYMTDASSNIVWNGNEYYASKYLGFSAIAETSELLVNSCVVSLSGVDQSVPALLLQESYLNRKLKIRKAFQSETGAIIASPLLIFDGRMDRPSISVEPTSGEIVCSVECVSHWTDFERLSGRHTNDAEQRTFFPDDRGFSKVAYIPSEIFWGIPQKIGKDNSANYNFDR